MNSHVPRLVLAALVLAGGPAVHADAGATFDPRTAAQPLFTDGPGKLALDALSRHEYTACARALKGYEPQTHANEARLLDGYCLLKAGDRVGAVAALDGLADKIPLLADYVRLWTAQAQLGESLFDAALAQAQKVSAESPLHAEAEVVEGNALERLSRAGEAAAVYMRYLAAYPDSWRAPEMRVKLATALDAAGRKDDATAVWRQVYIESPISFGARAAPRLDPQKPLNAVELVRRAKVLFDAMKNKESEQAWQQVLATPALDPRTSCTARFQEAMSVWRQRDRQRAAPLFEAAVDPCQAGHDVDTLARTLYMAGRSYGSRAEKDRAAGERAIALYQQLMKDAPAHSYADDAALREADVYDTLGDKENATAVLSSFPQRFPKGDQLGEALFRLAFRAFETKDYAQTATWLKQELSLLPREEGWWEAGRTLYWLGRADAAQGKGADAVQDYLRTLREYPLSCYALFAGNRLLELAPKELDKMLAELSWDPRAPVLAGPIADRPLFHTPAFQRALVLLSLGLGSEARRELGAAGIQAPKHGNPLPADRELGWVTSQLFEAAGDYAASHAYARYVDTDYAKSWPVGANELKWRLSYPRAYAALVEENVKKTGQPAALELAIMREESAFDPNLESFANAVGLTQLTPPPAARFAEGLAHDPQALRDPPTNIAIGARELGNLYALFDKHVSLAIAGYNAGEGAVKRWLRDPENKDRELDEFIERIPYDETRGYVKRVLGTYFTYAWLDGANPAPLDRMPRLHFTLPAASKKPR